MGHWSQEEVRRHGRLYLGVFTVLAILTALTVAVSCFHLPVLWAVFIALGIALFKGSLVATFFMHLSTEKRIIFVILLVTLVFFLALIFFPTMSRY